MSWEGYIEYAGNEIINVTRTETYARNAGARWFRPLFENDSLPYILGDGTYRTPLLDDAPWTDPDVQESYEFYGLYPLGIDGLENSSRMSVVSESLNDGGIAGRLRHGTKAVVFNCVLLAGSDAGAEYGMAWLRRVLLGGPCGPGPAESCFGESLCYLSSEPVIERAPAKVYEPATVEVLDGSGEDLLDGNGPEFSEEPVLYDGGGPDVGMPVPSAYEYPDPQECFNKHLRSLRRVVVNNGPTITAKRTMQDGGAAWQVQFTAVAGNPYEFGAEVPVIQGFLDPDVPVPWPNGVEPVGAFMDATGYSFTDVNCSEPVFQPIVDPLHPAIIPPPGPPSVPLGNFTPPPTWQRRQFTIPQQYVPLWGDVVPVLNVHARTADVRNLRLRFYADPYLVGDATDDPCAYCGDIVISYVPVGHTLVFDAAEERVYVTDGSGQQSADALVFATDGRPFEWPRLSCGFGYIVTLDLPKKQAPPAVDLSLISRTA